jgi:hypothetical protein
MSDHIPVITIEKDREDLTAQVKHCLIWGGQVAAWIATAPKPQWWRLRGLDVDLPDLAALQEGIRVNAETLSKVLAKENAASCQNAAPEIHGGDQPPAQLV